MSPLSAEELTYLDIVLAWSLDEAITIMLIEELGGRPVDLGTYGEIYREFRDALVELRENGTFLPGLADHTTPQASPQKR